MKLRSKTPRWPAVRDKAMKSTGAFVINDATLTRKPLRGVSNVFRHGTFIPTTVYKCYYSDFPSSVGLLVAVVNWRRCYLMRFYDWPWFSLSEISNLPHSTWSTVNNSRNFQPLPHSQQNLKWFPIRQVLAAVPIARFFCSFSPKW